MEYTKEQRIMTAFSAGPLLYAAHRIEEFFDVVYEPAIWDNRLQPFMLRLCYEESAINELRDDQVARLLNDATTSKQPLPQYLYAYWLYFNRIRWSETTTIVKMMRWAADCGIGDAAWFLRDMWLKGEVGIYDKEKAREYAEEADKKHSAKAFAYKVECEIYGRDGVAKDPMRVIKVLREMLELSNDPKDESFPEPAPTEDGQPRFFNPLLWHLLSVAYIEVGLFHAAEICARKTIDNGLINRGYADLFLIYTHDENGNEKNDWEKLIRMYNEGSNREDPATLLNAACYLMDWCEDDRTTDEQREKYTKQIRERLERAAQLSSGDACLLLGMQIVDAKYGYERNMEEAWKWFFRGTMAGSLYCVYRLYQMAAWAEDPNDDAKDGELKFLTDGSLKGGAMPAYDWERLAKQMYEAQGVEWPGDYEGNGEEGIEAETNEEADDETEDEETFDNQYDIEGTVLRRCVVGEPHTVIPEGITEIADSCFIQDGSALTGQSRLVSVTIPKSVVRIGNHAFMNSDHLESVTVLGPAEIGEQAFSGCDRLHEVWLADGVRSLGNNCFGFCKLLKSLYIPASVEHIGWCIAAQDDAESANLCIFCDRNEPAPGWQQYWNVIDEEDIGIARHKTFYGLRRDGFLHESYDSLVLPKPEVLPEPLNISNEYEVIVRCRQAQDLVRQQRWADVFDLLYTPLMPTLAEHKQLLSFFGSAAFVSSRLRLDQIERLQQDAAHELPTALFIYGYWKSYHTDCVQKFDEVIAMSEKAALAGWGDAWHTLEWYAEAGMNSEGRRDLEKAALYKQRAIETGCTKAVIYFQVKPVLYGWDDTPVNIEEGLRITQEAIRKGGGEDSCDPRLLSLLSECLQILDRMQEAERYARMAIRRGDVHTGYLSLYLSIFADAEGNALDVPDEEVSRFFDEGAAANCSHYLIQKAEELMALAEDETDEDCRHELEHRVRVLLERAALQGSGDACFTLALKANEGSYGFYGPRSDDTYPFFHLGALCNHKDCTYWMSNFAYSAQVEDVPLEERDVLLGLHQDNTSSKLWDRLARNLYEMDGETYPDDKEDEESSDDEEEDIEEDEIEEEIEEDDVTTTDHRGDNLNLFDVNNWRNNKVSMCVGQIEVYPITTLKTRSWGEWFAQARNHLIEDVLGSASINSMTVKVGLCVGYNKPQHYMDFPHEVFPISLYDQLYADDQDGSLNDVTGIQVDMVAVDSNGEQHAFGSFFFGNEGMHKLHQAALGALG